MLSFKLDEIVHLPEIAGMVIRPFRLSDYPAVYALWKRAGIDIGISDDPGELQRVVDLHSELFVVGENAGKIIATAIGSFDGRRAYIYHLAVEPDSQGKGIGSNILQYLETRLKEKGVIKCHLMVEPDNTGVIRFYEKQGWFKEDLIVLTRDLTVPEGE